MNLHRFPHGTISSVWCGVVRDIGDDWLLSILGSISGWHYMLVVVSKRNSDDFFFIFANSCLYVSKTKMLIRITTIFILTRDVLLWPFCCQLRLVQKYRSF